MWRCSYFHINSPRTCLSCVPVMIFVLLLLYCKRVSSSIQAQERFLLEEWYCQLIIPFVIFLEHMFAISPVANLNVDPCLLQWRTTPPSPNMLTVIGLNRHSYVFFHVLQSLSLLSFFNTLRCYLWVMTPVLVHEQWLESMLRLTTQLPCVPWVLWHWFHFRNESENPRTWYILSAMKSIITVLWIHVERPFCVPEMPVSIYFFS